MEEREMDWKQLVRFALQGSSGLEQYAILLIRVSIGLCRNRTVTKFSTPSLYIGVFQVVVDVCGIARVLISVVLLSEALRERSNLD
jgi:hypothetical protein